MSPPRRQIDVLLDTSALRARDFDQFASKDLKRLVSDQYPGLEVTWLVPEIVTLERERQMRQEALELGGKIAPLQRLLGSSVDVSAANVGEAVARLSDVSRSQLRLEVLALDYARCDWHEIVQQAIRREAPFAPGGEKGFRDRLIAETILQRVADRSGTTERVIFVCADRPLGDYIRGKTKSPHVEVFTKIDEAAALLHTLSSNITEQEVQRFRDLSQEAFNRVNAKDESFRRSVVEAIETRFATQLRQLPPGALARYNNPPSFSPAAFLGKDFPRLRWRSRATILAQCWIPTTPSSTAGASSDVAMPTFTSSLTPPGQTPISGIAWTANPAGEIVVPASTGDTGSWRDGRSAALASGSSLEITPPIGTLLRYEAFNELFDVTWRTELAGSGVTNAVLEDITHQRES